MKEFISFLEIVRTLRKECPWDRTRTLKDMANYLIEEIYEFMDAMEKGEKKKMEEEAGDILLSLLMMLVIMEEKGSRIDDIIKMEERKVISRHPHVFGEDVADTEREVLKKWEERKGEGFEVERHIPALLRSYKIQEKARRKKFDWERVEGVYNKIHEELKEFIHSSEDKKEEELGDLLFVVSHLANFFGINPEIALHRACDKFIKRFGKLEEYVRKEGKDIDDMDMETLDRIWEEIKRKYR